MRFLIDAQLSPALARWLEAEGHDAEHVADRQMEAASDHEIWFVAAQIGATIISKDEDFARRRTLESLGPCIVWLRLPNTRKTALLRWFAQIFPQIVSALERGETLIEVI